MGHNDPPTPTTVPSPPHSPQVPSAVRLVPSSPPGEKSSPAVPESPLTNPRFSPVTNSQPSPNAQYAQLDKPHDLGGSVRHLEAAMTRHLPQEGGLAGTLGAGPLSGVAGGFSTIQWAGGQEPPSTAILRQLYAAKRETVIRTSRDSSDLATSLSNSSTSTSPSVTNSVSATTGILPHNPPYPGYHLSSPPGASPDRLKHHPCDPYTELYPSLYPATGPQKNPYDALRSPWYPA